MRRIPTHDVGEKGSRRESQIRGGLASLNPVLRATHEEGGAAAWGGGDEVETCFRKIVPNRAFKRAVITVGHGTGELAMKKRMKKWSAR